MIAEYASVEFTLLAIFTAWIVWWIAGLIGLSWYLGFAGVFLLPLDIAQGSYIGMSPTLLNLWLKRVVYWSTFILAWAILPVLYEAWYAGDITWKGRLKTALRVNLKFYALGAVLGLLFVVYLLVAGKTTLYGLPSFLMIFGNTYGLLLVIVLLGSGLVELPRDLWRHTDPKRQLEKLYFLSVQSDSDVYDCECDLKDAAKDIRVVARRLPESAPDHLKEFANQILEKSDSMVASTQITSRSSRAMEEELQLDVDGSLEQALAKAHSRYRLAHEKLHSARLRWQTIVDEIDAYELLMTGSLPEPSPDEGYWVRAVYLWRTRLKVPVLRFFACLAVFMSVMVVWSELTVAFPVNLSPWGRILSSLSSGGNERDIKAEALFFQLFALIPYAYMSACTYYTLFNLRLFGLFTLAGPQQSATGPLIFNAIYLIRLQFPLGYTYLTMISPPHAHGDDLSSDVAFQELMSHMETVPMFGQDFYVYAPILLGIFCLCSVYHLYPWLLKIAGIDHEDNDSADADEIEEKMKEGKTLIDKWRRKQERIRKKQEQDGTVVSALHSSSQQGRVRASIELSGTRRNSGTYTQVRNQESAAEDDIEF